MENICSENSTSVHAFSQGLAAHVRMKRCVDCNLAFCDLHIQHKEMKGYMCIDCEMGITDSDYKNINNRLHPRFVEELV